MQTMRTNNIKNLFTTLIVLYLVSGQIYPNLHFHVHRHYEKINIEICLKPLDQYHIHTMCCDMQKTSQFGQYNEADIIKKSTISGQYSVSASGSIDNDFRNIFVLHTLTTFKKSLQIESSLNNKAPPLSF